MNFDGTADDAGVNADFTISATDLGGLANNAASYEILVWSDSGYRIELAGRNQGSANTHIRWQRAVNPNDDPDDPNNYFLEVTRMEDLNGDGTMETGTFRVYESLRHIDVNGATAGGFEEFVIGRILIHTDIIFDDITIATSPQPQ